MPVDRVDVANVDEAVIDVLPVYPELIEAQHAGARKLHHVPFDVAGIDHRLHLGGVGAGDGAHLDPAELLERIEVGALLRILHGAAIADDSHFTAALQRLRDGLDVG